ncbi:MAG: DUF4282 domain-containing protein [Polyangiaceae bacterium]
MQSSWAQPPSANTPPPQASTPIQADFSSQKPGAKPFIQALFDFKFESFIAPRLLGILYGLFLAVLALGVLFGIGSGVYGIFDAILSKYSYNVSGRIMSSLMTIAATPFVAALYVLLGRMYFEVLAVLFRGVALLESIDTKSK